MPRAAKLEQVNVSSILDYQACPLRWCYKWIENRVPVQTPTVLDVGKVLHRAFEVHFNEGTPIGPAFKAEVLRYEGAMLSEHEQKALDVLMGLIEPMQFWKDQFQFGPTLEVEEPFEFMLDIGVPFRGRPDRVAMLNGKVFHVQTKTIGAQVKLDDFLLLAQRNLHELIYGRWLKRKYEAKGLEYGGTVYSVVKKLKFRSKQVTKKEPFGKILHSVDEMFSQSIVPLTFHQEEDAFDELSIITREMDRTADKYIAGGMIVPNRKADAGWHGKGLDPYTYVLLGERSLDDDTYFTDRVDTYDAEPSSEEEDK